MQKQAQHTAVPILMKGVLIFLVCCILSMDSAFWKFLYLDD